MVLKMKNEPLVKHWETSYKDQDFLLLLKTMEALASHWDLLFSIITVELTGGGNLSAKPGVSYCP